MLRIILFPFFVFILLGCSSPDDEARELIAESRVLYQGCESIDFMMAENEILESCIVILTKASSNMDILFESYGATPASNEILTHKLKRSIESKLRQFKYGLNQKNKSNKVWDSGPNQWQ